MAIPDSIKKLGHTSPYIRMMLCAGPGFGKTVFFGTGDEKVLFLTTDPEGTVSAFTMGSDAREWRIEGWNDLVEAYKYLSTGGVEELGIEWIVLDNASEAQEQAKWLNIDIEHKRNPVKIDQFVPTQANYQRTQNMFISMVKQFNTLPVHVGYTSWIEKNFDDNGDEYYSPAIHGQRGSIAEMVAGYMNVVGYGQVIRSEGKEIRRIWFSHKGAYRGKDRYNVLTPKKDDLTLPQMQKMIEDVVNKTKVGVRRSAPAKTAVRPKRAATKTAPKAATTRRKA